MLEEVYCAIYITIFFYFIDCVLPFTFSNNLDIQKREFLKFFVLRWQGKKGGDKLREKVEDG